MNAELGFGIIRGFEGPELAGTPAQQTCSRCERAHGLCRRSSKLGFLLVASRFEVSLVFWTGVFLSPGRRIRVIGKETGPGPGGYG